jgi:hypothetical protein
VKKAPDSFLGDDFFFRSDREKVGRIGGQAYERDQTPKVFGAERSEVRGLPRIKRRQKRLFTI